MNPSNVFSSEELTFFEERGYVRVREAFPAAAALAMQDFIWAQIQELHGIDRYDRSTWTNPWPATNLNKTGSNPIYGPITSSRLCGAIDQLLGAGGWTPPKSWGGFLVSFPALASGSWEIPSSGWHWDGNPFFHADQMRGLFIFTFCSAVKPQGGGTIIAAGSHRLLNRCLRSLSPGERPKHSPLIKHFSRSNEWLTELTTAATTRPDRTEHFMAANTDVDGVRTQVVEMTGEPGDAILCHPCIFHAVSPNRAEVPRFMRVKGLLKHP